MTIVSVHDYELESDTDNIYDITIDNTTMIKTLVTCSDVSADNWVRETLGIGGLVSVVGLDIEWRPNFSRHIDNPAATLQLCCSNNSGEVRCLIFQLLYADGISPVLAAFLGDPTRRFAGVGVAHDAEKLLLDYGLAVRATLDLGDAAARAYSEARLRGAGLKELALRVVGIDVQKPRRITMGRWDYRYLSVEQVRYACIDAYASFAIAHRLTSGNQLP